MSQFPTSFDPFSQGFAPAQTFHAGPTIVDVIAPPYEPSFRHHQRDANDSAPQHGVETIQQNYANMISASQLPQPSSSSFSGAPPHTFHQPQDQNHQLHFSSFMEALAGAERRNWAQFTDVTIPTTDYHRQRCVLDIVNAISNLHDIVDAESGPFKKRWFTPTPGEEPYYSAMDKELVAWEIVSLAEELHTVGPSCLLSFDKKFWPLVEKSQDLTFGERIGKIVEILRISKARCEKLFAGQGLQALVAHPDGLLQQTLHNRENNQQRQHVLEAGRDKKKDNNKDRVRAEKSTRTKKMDRVQTGRVKKAGRREKD